jgi:hypothetical protein
MLRHQPAARGLSAHGPLAFRSKPSLVARRGQDVEILKISGDRLLRDANRRWMHWGLAVVAPLAIRGRHVASPCAISSALRHVVTPVRVSWRAMLRFDFWIRASGFGRDNWAGRSPVFPCGRRCISQAFLMCDRTMPIAGSSRHVCGLTVWCRWSRLSAVHPGPATVSAPL